MNKQNNKNHRNLIEQLINCANKREINEIIRNNFDDIDINFLRMLQQERVRLQQEDNSDKGNLLKDIVRQLAEFLGIEKDELRIAEIESSKLPLKIDGNTSLPTPSIMTSSSVPRSESQHRFILRVLQATYESKGNPQIVYPLLQGNIHLLDDNFAQVLKNWATGTLSVVEPDTAYAFAATIFDFSNLIEEFPLGKQAINLEIAIAGYETIVSVSIPRAFPVEWAMTQYNLGGTYRNRIKGEKADNLERAIECYRQALSVRTRNVFPVEWARIQNNLGAVYHERIRGEKAKNLKLAIECYQQALSIRTREEFPLEWARTHMNLGNTYRDIIRGEKADNLEQGIECSQQALSVFTREEFPFEWAAAQNNLGVFYNDRIKGEKADNLELAIECSQQALSVFTREKFPFEWAKTQSALGLAYCNRIRGKKADNIELAIDYSQQALLVFTREEFAFEWAAAQNNLGLAYRDRIRGKKADNIELAIDYSQQALLVFTREEFTFEWATAQNNLGFAYRDRIRGEKADNLESAIEYYHQALSVYTLEKFPLEWARTNMNLGSAYFDKIRGEKADNLERAIKYCQQALSILNRNTSPFEWAMTQNNLVGSYNNRIRGEKAENLERAIDACQQALLVYTYEAFPFEWARIQNNLAGSYNNRIRGEKAENLERAIDACQQALLVYTYEAFPFEWARIQNSLAVSYNNRIRGEKAENLERAIDAYQQALLVYTHEAFPFEWAMTQNNLGAAYYDRIKGEKTENLEQAIEAYQQVLLVYTREAFPTDWAKAQNNLGAAYSQRLQGNKAENMKRSIEAYQSALSVRTREAFPQNNVETLFNLGIAYQTSNQLQLAYDTFESGIKTLELVRDDIHSGDDIKQKLAEEWTGLYHRIVAVCLEISRETEAIEYVERSKTRNLIELILTKDRHTIFPAEVVTQLDRLRDEIASGQYQLQNATAEDPTALVQHIQQLREQRNELQDRYLPIGSGFQFEQFRSTLSDRTAIIEFFVRDDKLIVFIITKQTQQPIVLSPDLIDPNKLANWAISYLKAYRNKKSHWQRRLTTRLNLLAKILHIDEIIKQIPIEYKQLILIPHRYLHLLPLHALPLAGDSNLFDRFPEGVSYAPSCQLQQLAQTRQRPEFNHLFAVQNPTNDLTYTDIEVETIQSYFNTSNLLKQEIATKEAIDDTSLTAVHCAHFSCHGYFNATQPRKSALILANAHLNSTPTQPDAENYLSLASGGVLDLNKCLTLDSIFTLNLEQCRLVTLSACETGLIDSRNTSDEYIGLPSGFLYAGAASVVSSLWTVNDLSTAFLMIQFYQNLQKGLTVALALNQAQLWLRDITGAKLWQWIQEKQLPLDPTQKLYFRRMPPNSKPFQNPFYWAAFSAIGQ